MISLRFCVFSLVIGGAIQCGPGRGSQFGRRSMKMTPLVFKQHVPNVSENNLGASGLAEGRITRNDARFKDLVINYNPYIIFKDDEGTGTDRYMTQVSIAVYSMKFYSRMLIVVLVLVLKDSLSTNVKSLSLSLSLRVGSCPYPCPCDLVVEKTVQGPN